MTKPNDQPHLRRLPLFLLLAAVVFTLSLDIYDCYTTVVSGLPQSALWLTLFESLTDLFCLIAIYVLLTKNLREQWQKTKEIETISDSKSEILSIVSHDLRSPLGVIMGFAQVLDENLQDPENRRITKRILLNTQHTLNLINDLISQNALDGGGLRIKKSSAQVTSLVKDVVDTQKLHAEQKRIVLHCEALDEITAPLDQQKFRQIVDNLVSNAVKYSPSDSTVNVGLNQTGNSFHLTVKDQGPGLSPKEMEQVFHKFSPVKKRPTGGEFSTGLGLSITQRLVNLQDGRIWVESEGEGRGCTFHVEMPAIEAPGKT